LAEALKRKEADAFAMSSLLLRWAAGLAEERDAALTRVSAPLRERYEAAVQQGLDPALDAAHNGRCPGCGEALSDTSRRRVKETLCLVQCSGCLLLLYDYGSRESHLMPSPRRSVARATP
jgi:hypothetical protein